MTRTRNWSITYNNPSETKDEVYIIISNVARVDYCIIGEEFGKENNTRHYQIFVRFKNAITFKGLKKALPKAHIEITIKNERENINYCMKEGNYATYGDNEKLLKEFELKEKEKDLSNLIDDIISLALPYPTLCRKYYKYVLYNYNNFKNLVCDLLGISDIHHYKYKYEQHKIDIIVENENKQTQKENDKN